MHLESFSFGLVRIDGVSYEHDVVIDRGEVRKRKKKASKRFRDLFGHTPVSVEEEIPWKCRRLVIGTGGGALPVMEEVKREAAKFMKISAVWQFVEAERKGNSIALFAPDGDAPLHTFHFPRQRVSDKLCLSDYVLPSQNGTRDHIALFVVTAGAGIRERAEAEKAAGNYLFSHGLQALALETAEACAEWLHRRIREDWGFPDPPAMTMPERFVSRYRGKRYSFGYPACPNLEDQAGIWMLLRPEEIGVHLTEGMMMDPEASVSALVFHHPDCTYFSVGEPSGS